MLQRVMDILERIFQRPDIPFSREDASRYLPWVIAVMVCLVGLLLTAGISLHQVSEKSGQLNVQSFQVFVPYDKSSKELNDAVTTLLRDDEAVQDVEAVPVQTLETLITPWTADAVVLEDLPLPYVLEVTLRPEVDRSETIPRLEAALKEAEPEIDVESYQEWVDQLTQFTGMLRLGVFLLVSILLAALLALVAVIVRTSLQLHFQSVRLLHHVGATDDYIIRQFVINGSLLVLKGSAMGMGLASILAVSISYVSVEWASPILPAISLSGAHVLTLIFLPLMMVGLTALLVRITIMQMLEQMH